MTNFKKFLSKKVKEKPTSGIMFNDGLRFMLLISAVEVDLIQRLEIKILDTSSGLNVTVDLEPEQAAYLHNFLGTFLSDHEEYED